MSPHLPARPHLDHLRAQAKSLLADLRAGKAAAAKAFIAHLPAAKGRAITDVLGAGFRLADAQAVVAREAGFPSWAALTRHVDALRALEGGWTFVSLEVDGQAMPDAMFANSRLLIDGDRFRMESADATYEGVFTIDVEAEPARIDIEFVEGPEAGHCSYGLFLLDGDRLTICLGLAGAPRPTAFRTSAGSGHALERLVRESASRPPRVTGGTRRATPQRVADAGADPAAFDMAMTPLLERLQGAWTPVALVSSGQPLAAEMLAFGSRTTTGQETRVVFGGQTMVHAKVRLDESHTPIAIDYLNIGRGPRVVSLGIMAWDGGELRVCMARAGAPRPTSFTSSKDNGWTFSQWRRRTTG